MQTTIEDTLTVEEINTTQDLTKEERIDPRCTKGIINKEKRLPKKVWRTKWQEVSNLRQENNASLRHLETQVAQNSKALAERPQGTLSSTTVNNPRERVQAVTLRSGKELPERTLKKNTNSKSPVEEDRVEEILEDDNEQEKETSPVPSSPKATQSQDKGKEKMPPRSRNKERAKKRKHDVGSSSGAVEAESDLLIAGCRSLRHLSGTQIERVEELQAKGVLGGFYFDYTLLDAYGCRAEMERMMSQRFWEHIFSWRDGTYEPVVHEFITTFEHVPSNHMCTPCMKFTLFGREYQVSLIQLGRYLGFYTQDDLNTEEWRNLPSDFDSDVAAEAYWHRITDGEGDGLHGATVVPYVLIGPVVTRLCHGLGLQRELAREKSIASMRPFSVAHLNRSYAPKIGDVPRPPQGEPQHGQEPVIEGEPDVPPEYVEYPPVYDWASMRTLQLQLHTHSMDTFNRRMDLQHKELMRQNEAIIRQNEAYTRQEERQEQQFQAIEQLRLWMEHRFPPPSQGGDGPY
nr:uncharacterized protein LOC109154451 [Ipomoea batatas]